MQRNTLLLCFAVTVLCAVYATRAYAEPIVLDEDSFFKSVRTGVWLVKFYAPWCPHCKSLAPKWEELSTQATDFKVAQVNCEENRIPCEALGVNGYPAVFLFSGPASGKNVDSRAQRFSGPREVENFIQFVKDNAKPTDAVAEEPEEPEQSKPTTKPISDDIEPSDVPAIDITKKNVDQLSSGAWFIEFYAPWCGYCKKLAPTYAEFAQVENAKGDFKVAKVNCDVEKDICNQYSVRGFPTLKFVLNGAVHDHVGAQSVVEMGNFARGLIEDASSESGDVIILTNNNFERKVMSRDGAWMIDFYATWCGHCKDMAPAWEQFAKTVRENGDSVNVAKIECDANEALCERFGVENYPSIKLLQVKSYPGNKDRTAAGFQSFWEKYEGVHSNAAASDVVILNHENFRSKTRNGLWLVDYYAPWCGHCKQLSPILEELATAQKGNFFVGKIDCEGKGNEGICEEIEVFPTLIAYQDGKKIGKYNADRTVQMLGDWMEAFEDEIPEDEEEITDVATLTPENFKRRVSEGNWVIEFFAPWCGHCKQLQPIWEELAIIENPAGRVKVGKVDCSRYPDLCSKHDISSYPTITFFKNGKEKKPRQGGDRKLASLQAYIDKFVPRSAGQFDTEDIL